MARLTLTPQLEHLRASVEAARATLEPEAIHQARVASRRLRVFLTLGGVHVLRDDLRWLARALSRLRDLDVAMAERFGGDFGRWLTAQHEVARRAATDVLQHPRLDGVLRALSFVGPVPKRLALERRSLLVDAVETAWIDLRKASRAGALEALHRVRRRARSARYASEWLGAEPGPFRRLQEAAGAACDVMALGALVREYEAATNRASPTGLQLDAVVVARFVPALLEAGVG
ncbi:MAG: CHAD domain-containing protein [Myxococcaceae bacterium]|jgi:CHAD domain-containing protein|nr:CHAD domain-containing protein [Myxococcaceae bacterium]